MFDFGLYTQVSDSGPQGPLVIIFIFSNSHNSVPQEAQRNVFIVHTPGNESVFNPKLFFLNDTAA